VPKGRNAVLSFDVPVHFPGMLASLPGLLKSLPGVFLPGFVILLVVRIRSCAMSMSGTLVNLRGSLMILVMRSVVIALRHL